MAEAQFTAPTAPGQLGSDFIGASEAGQSFMNRAIAAKQQQELTEQQINLQNILMPVHQAQAQANIITAASSIANATRMQQFRAQAGLVAKQANDEYLDAIGLADWDAQSQALGNLQAKYSWMNQLPEYQGFLHAIDESRANAVKRSLTDQQLQSLQDRLEITQQMLNQRVGMVVQGREDVAGINAGSRESVAQTAAGARTAAADITGKSRVEAAGVRSNRNYELERSIQLMNDARNRGDSEEASFYANRIRKLNTIAGETPPPVATPQSPAVAPKAAPSIPSSTPLQPLSFNASATDAGDIPAQSEEPESTPSPSDTEAQENPQVPEPTPAPVTPPVTGKLYVLPQKPGEEIHFVASVKTPKDRLAAVQQLVDDKVISPDQARKYLLALGFKPNK